MLNPRKMPKKLQKSLSEYFAKIKKPTPQIPFPNSKSFSSSKTFILSGCKHPKTLSFAIDRRQVDGDHNNAAAAATLSDIDRFLVENFGSLYLKDGVDLDRDGKIPKGVPPESPTDGGSHRFFSSPGLSDSSENGGSSSPSLNCVEQSKNVKLPNDCIAILKYSPSPSEEFRRSMQEMMDAHLQSHEKVDWEFMEELLFCFLNLNEKKYHKYILNAFVDLVVILRQKSDDAPAKPRSVRMVRKMM